MPVKVNFDVSIVQVGLGLLTWYEFNLQDLTAFVEVTPVSVVSWKVKTLAHDQRQFAFRVRLLNLDMNARLLLLN